MQENISVIIPVYRVEDYLPRCLESVLRQTYKELEIILVDDGSPDNSGKICDDYAAKDNRIKVIHQENAGVSAARNKALAIATGAYVTFLDADDYLPEDALQTLCSRIQFDSSDMAIGKHCMVFEDGHCDDSGDMWMKDAIYSAKDIFDHMHGEHQFTVGIMAKMYRREIFEEIQFPNLICGEDLYLFPLLVERCRRISVVAQNVYFYYQRTGSAVHTHNLRTTANALEAALFMTQQLLRNNAADSAATWFDFCIMRAFWLEDSKQARKLMRRYLPLKTRLGLLLRQKPKTWVLWAAVYISPIRSVVRWKVRSNKRRRGKS